jgi:3'(2'),5'-bisphosphate nucleotidase
MDAADAGRLLENLTRVSEEAGAAVMSVYAAAISVDYKTDASPVTEADRRAEEIILERLKEIAPGVGVLSEEAASNGAAFVPQAEFFLVDPLDGTKEFIGRNGEFTVNIALIREGAPVAGAVFAPALSRLYLGARGLGAWRVDTSEDAKSRARTKIETRRPQDGLVAVASRSHRSPETDAYLKTLDIASFAEAGSSLKFCLIAEGAADIYPRFGRTMEWDTAAGQAVLEAAGGRVVVHPSGEPLSYGKGARGYDNPHFIAYGAT